jgi:hypothetical protein
MDESVHALRAGAREGCDDRTGALHLSEATEAADRPEASREPFVDLVPPMPRHD